MLCLPGGTFLQLERHLHGQLILLEMLVFVYLGSLIFEMYGVRFM